MKIQGRLDYFMISKALQSSVKYVKIVPSMFSDHSALTASVFPDEREAKHGPGFWKFNNLLLIDKDYVELISGKIPEFASKYREVTDKGLLWEMIKMEIRAATIVYSKKKACYWDRNFRKCNKVLKRYNRHQN